MARSFARIRPSDFRPPVSYVHQPSGLRFSLTEHDGALYQRRWRAGYNGAASEIEERRVDYVLGSGNHARTLLNRTARGTLFELPLAWYAENGGEWAMGPGLDRPYAVPPRTIAYECMFCHNAYPRIPRGNEEAGREALYTGDLPEGIDCQRCHGPGAAHVGAAQSASPDPAAIRRAIVNPARLSSARRMEVCMQCHLETTSRPLPHSLVRDGRGPFSYRPGEPLGEFMIFFDRAGGPHPETFEIVNSVYRLRQSRCFLQSAGKLTCTTCHNPHDIPRGAEAARQYNAACARCHTAPLTGHAERIDCVGCHMPKRRTQDVIHAVMTDHLIQRRAPPNPLAPLAEVPDGGVNAPRGKVTVYYPQDKVYEELGQALLRAGKRTGTAAALHLADTLTQSGQLARAASVLESALRVTPDDPMLWYQLGIAQSSIPSWQKAVDLDPDFMEARNLLGAALAGRGDFAAGERQLRMALAVNPDYPDALGNLGHLLAATSHLPEAAFYLGRAATLKSNDAEIRVNYAVTLAGLNRFAEARTQIDAALKADPKSAEAHNFRGTLLEHGGDPSGALAEFLEAVRLQPDFDRAHFNTGRLLAARGETASALPHLQRAARSADPNLRRQAESLLHQIH